MNRACSHGLFALAVLLIGCSADPQKPGGAAQNLPPGGGGAGSSAGGGPSFQTPPVASQADIHRLNRAEYANTIRDLTGIAFDAAGLLVDSTAFGFDNISSIQTSTPGHVEAYLGAAERIADEIVDRAPTDVSLRYEASAMEVGKFGGQDHRDLIKDLGDGFWQLGGSDELRVTLRLPRDGTYKITVHARQASIEERIGNLIEPQGNPFVDFSTDAKLAGSVEITQTSALDYVLDLPLTKGVHSFAVGAHVGNCTSKVINCGPLVHVKSFAIENSAVADADPSSPFNRVFTCKPAPGQEAPCAAQILRAFATRAWRRPVAPDSLAQLVTLVNGALTGGAGFEEAIGVGLRDVLSSPRFLYRIEAAADPVQGYRTLDGYELASRLSYFLWSSMPDAELFGVADQATLTQPAVLQAQVSRMLSHQNAQALTDNFAGQWLFQRAIPGVTKNALWHPAYDVALNAALAQEAKTFFAFIAEGGGSAIDLITGDYSFLNDRLRQYYGLPETGGTTFERTSLSATGRRGLLGQAGLLSYLAGPERSSPVSRGKWVLNQLLCTEAAPPPKDVPSLPALTDTENMTMRNVMEQHRASPACAGCHQLMDPMGFALENFDAAGKWIDDYRGQPLDLTGQMPTTGVAFNGPTELAAAIAGDSRFARCVTSKLFTYATARGPDAFDDAQIDVLTQDFAAASFSFPALVAKLVSNPAFTLRRANDAPSAQP